jgi:CRISPR-associated protein Cas1
LLNDFLYCHRRAALKVVEGWRKLSIPIHHLESICVFGASTISSPALDLCREHGVAVNFHGQFGYLQARMTGVADTSVTLRRPGK